MPPRKSAASRAARVAAISAGVSSDYLGYLARRVFTRGDEDREALRKATNRSAARRVTDEMMELKGPLMKLGQTLSLQTDVLPAEALEELSRLQMSAPAMHPALARAQFRASLKRDPEDVFATFDPVPFAAASLGQVHRAVTRQGDDVAVKIQYPGIRETIEGDVKWFRAAMLPARLSKHFPDTMVRELKEQLLLETDYAREVENMRLFARNLRGQAFVTVPTPFGKLCGDKVLTMSRLDGVHLDTLLAGRLSQTARDRIGAHLVQLYFHQVLLMGVLHGDPHWGNYLFHADGRIGLLDFGCVKYLDAAFVKNLRKVFLFPGRRDSPEFLALMEERYALAGVKLSKAAKTALSQMAEHFYGLVYPSEVEKDSVAFDFSDAAILARYMENSSRLMQAKASLPEYIMLARAEIGLYQTLHRLRARVHMSRIVREILALPYSPAS